jgi:hypothetical protein
VETGDEIMQFFGTSIAAAKRCDGFFVVGEEWTHSVAPSCSGVESVTVRPGVPVCLFFRGPCSTNCVSGYVSQRHTRRVYRQVQSPIFYLPDSLAEYTLPVEVAVEGGGTRLLLRWADGRLERSARKPVVLQEELWEGKRMPLQHLVFAESAIVPEPPPPPRPVPAWDPSLKL